MSLIKAFAVGHGDMYYIDHNSDNLSIIDCCLNPDRTADILDEVDDLRRSKGVTRVISTHPDDDHIRGLELLDERLGIINFYCIQNRVVKAYATDSFTKYRELRDSPKAFFIQKGCSRRWMNLSDGARKTSGIDILWPDPSNDDFKAALESAEAGGSPNNISTVVKYSVDRATALWMGDLETTFMEAIAKSLVLPKVTVLFAPHHGRDSGRVPSSLMDKMRPKIVVVGEAPSEHLCYYEGYNTITQNRAGDILFDCLSGQIDVFTSNPYDADFLEDRGRSRQGYYYAGSLEVNKA